MLKMFFVEKVIQIVEISNKRLRLIILILNAEVLSYIFGFTK